MVKLMKKNLTKKCLFCFALIFILCVCKQEPIFYAISLEVKPVEPRIKGVSTNFAVYEGCMYVASGNTLYKYYKDEDRNKVNWSKETQPGGKILQIASTGGYLYALCSDDHNINGRIVIKRFYNSSWTETDGDAKDLYKIHNIFAANDMLFIMAVTSANYSYTILYIDDNSGTIKELNIDTAPNQIDTGEISGAAFDGTSYFLSAKNISIEAEKNRIEKNSGVYKIDDISTGASLIKYRDADGNTLNINPSGIINLKDTNNTILLIARNGDVYTVKNSITKIENISLGYMSSGALAIWKENETSPDRLLLAGRQDSLNYSMSSGYTYGYLELQLDENGIKNGSNFVEPGLYLLSSVKSGENERFKSTIGKYPVNYLFQIPYEIDSEMILFASTQKNGVWSYRVRGDIFQWNAEE
jgi:hypothetical protein